MRKLGSGWKLFIGVMAIFLAFGLAFVIYLHFDVPLSSTLHDDYIFLGFILILTLLLIIVLLWFTRRLDSSITRRHAEEKTEMRRQLTQNISHELKTPVASIQGFLETLLQNPDISEETRRMFLERSYAQTLRLSSLLQDISQLNRMDDAPTAMQDFAPVDVAATIHLIARETALQLSRKHMSLDIRIPEKIVVSGNASLIYSIFRNLIDNAIAYAGEGVRIGIEATEARGHWNFTFSDNGTGVEAKHLNRLFERFYRVDKGRSRKMGGTGLGLAIVKNAVLLHGGSIKVSDAKPGLRFDFTLKK